MEIEMEMFGISGANLEESPTGRATCVECRKPIAKGVYRIHIRFAGGMRYSRASYYLHRKCGMKVFKKHIKECGARLEEWKKSPEKVPKKVPKETKGGKSTPKPKLKPIKMRRQKIATLGDLFG